jgi:hypothetical protein
MFRIELGMAIVDDGTRLFRIELATFKRVLSADDIAGDRSIIEVVEKHPTVFQLFPTSADAATSLKEREI